MNTEWLKDFLTVAELRNFTRAAQARNASQAAFSRRIMSLEAWLGITLIDRSVFPTRLTPEGETFREHAAEIVNQISQARTDLAERLPPTRDQVRIALPHALATSKLGEWSGDWARASHTRHAVVAGNVHDMVTSLVAGGVDLLICFHTPQEPFHLSAGQYERLTIGTTTLAPYAAPALLKALPSHWFGSSRHPVPALMYSPGAYLARMVDQILKTSPATFYGATFFESDMADVLRGLAVAGQGLAWLPDCSAALAPAGSLIALGDPQWTLCLPIIAYRARDTKRAAVERLWRHLLSQAGAGSALPGPVLP